jgi:phosphate transport system substrate-binding protein
MKKIFLTASAAAVALAASAGYAAARDQIQIVGSSTVFPFTTAVAEKLGQGGKFKTPVVESTGTGGGIKLFCSGVGEGTPDFANASRAIKDSELETCKGAGVTPVEIKIGFDGIVLANSKAGAQVDLTKEQIFKALAKNVAWTASLPPIRM